MSKNDTRFVIPNHAVVRKNIRCCCSHCYYTFHIMMTVIAQQHVIAQLVVAHN
jgi:hypothetical protein